MLVKFKSGSTFQVQKSFWELNGSSIKGGERGGIMHHSTGGRKSIWGEVRGGDSLGYSGSSIGIKGREDCQFASSLPEEDSPNNCRDECEVERSEAYCCRV